MWDPDEGVSLLVGENVILAGLPERQRTTIEPYFAGGRIDLPEDR